MSLYSRNSLHLGPLRLNIPKGGLGISADAKGLPIQTATTLLNHSEKEDSHAEKSVR